MKVSYLIRSKSENATIYLRLRTDIHDLRVKTLFNVNPENWISGKVKPFKIGRSVSADGNRRMEVNKRLIELQNDLNDLSHKIMEVYRVSGSDLSKEWLVEIIQPKKERPKTLSEYVPVYFRLSNLRPSTEKKVKSIINRLLGYKDVRLTEVNRDFRVKLHEHLIEQNYAHNTIAKTIKVMQTLCTHAHDNGFTVHPDSLRFANKIKYNKSPIVYLTLDEIEKIRRKDFDNERLSIARDWLLISVDTGQRIGDFFRITKKDIIERDSMRFFSIVQRKGEKPVTIPIIPAVEAILKRYNGDLPPMLLPNPETNEIMYNRFIKRVCKQAEINELTEANLRNSKTKRYETRTVEKWEAVSSHIGRRSFATNYFGRIPTGLIRAVTGHASESQLLKYIGKAQSDSAVEAGKAMRALDLNKPNLSIIHKAN